MMNQNFKKIAVKTWYLEYHSDIPNSLNDSQLWENPDVSEYIQLYKKVGEKWGWTGRLLLEEKKLQEILLSSENEVWLFCPGNKIMGFFEIDRSIFGKAEIVYFGLIPEAIGKGLGSSLMQDAIYCAGKEGDQVWLHTCEYDHERALDAYKKAGFKVISESIDHEYYPADFIKRK